MRLSLGFGACALSAASLLIAHPTPASGKATPAVQGADRWRFNRTGAVAILSTRYAPVTYFVPHHPRHVLVLAFGYPWDEASDATILSYAWRNLAEWIPFAERNHVLIVAPVLGGTDFLDYRTLEGRVVPPDAFVDALADGPVKRALPGSSGRFCIHGHSAGGQFVARFVVAHPERIECAYLSAPSTYAMPTELVEWPFGMGPGKSLRAAPSKVAWVRAAAGAPVEVIVGSRDVEPRPPALGQIGTSRLERGRAWVSVMRSLALESGRTPNVWFTEVPGLAHEEHGMALAAQQMLHAYYVAKLVSAP
ncbi:hypothetical protein [Sphingomonas sp. UYP23]